jgi:hypothetical protein
MIDPRAVEDLRRWLLDRRPKPEEETVATYRHGEIQERVEAIKRKINARNVYYINRKVKAGDDVEEHVRDLGGAARKARRGEEDEGDGKGIPGSEP